MATWGLRSGGYKLGVFVLFLAALFFLIGFSSPFWVYVKTFIGLGRGATVTFSSGLWMACTSSANSRSCSSGYVESTAGWWKLVQAMQCIALFGLGVSCLYSMVINCAPTSPAFFYRFLEILTAVSGMTGFVSVMIYVGKTSELLAAHYSWAFGLDLAGCLLAFVSAIILAVTNRRDLADQANQGGAVCYQGAPVGPEGAVLVQGGSHPPGVAAYPSQQGAYPSSQPYPAGPPPQYPAGAPPQYPSAPSQQAGSWDAPPPSQGWAAPPGYSGYNYASGYSGAQQYSMPQQQQQQQQPLEEKPTA